ncbi:hypothetical protein BV898_13329 [Hypsibius exemplaris]|uniref:Uncharacterized protein n=1 Tax=Hypsibius exemplaris TaxID=2072580 RepID=A0A1W0WAX4_HYPEX|nr:hypothetical protein BV898_13329 [Hypsibius exemplaris]
MMSQGETTCAQSISWPDTMLRSLSVRVVVVAIVIGLVAGAARNEKCETARDCADAGTSCIGSRCICWTDMGPSAADIWSCDDDRICEKRFPGHVCQASVQCVPTANRMGYCRPR